jgi:hypothetical protein
MYTAVYNSGIPEITRKSVNRASRSAFLAVALHVILPAALLMVAPLASAADWNIAEQQLAKKIVAVTGPGAVALTFENRSSLGRRDSDAVQNGIRGALEQLGLRFVKAEQAAATVTISLSENPTSSVWVAQIHQGANDSAVVMVSVPRSGRSAVARDTMPISLRKTLLWAQEDPFLDLAILDDSGTPTHIAVLNPESVVIYRNQSGKWQQEQTAEIAHARPWPRDLRGRLIPGKDHLLDVYLPGVSCRSGATGSPLTLNCRETDDPWPMAFASNTAVFPSAGSVDGPSAGTSIESAFFASSRNFFTGVLTPAVGKFSTVPKFYSAAFVPRDKYTLWLFAGTDGKVHMIDGMNDQTSKLEWGSDIASVKTACGAGWQVLATTTSVQAQDSVRAYEFPDRDPVAVSAPVDLPGAISAMWAESRGDTATAIVRNRETGSYEAYRLDLACSQ